MKKTLFSVFALFTFSLCDAQVKTQSNYDVDGNGEVTIEDVTSTVNKVLGKASSDRTLVDGESLNALLLKLEQKLDVLQKEHELIMEKLSKISTVIDPYNGHEYVDLGLPSGLKWATCNVGASTPEDYGYYFAWGATEPQELYDWVHTPYQTQNTTADYLTKWTKYLGSTSSSNKDPNATDADALKTVLDPEDDAAHVNWGGNWRMPTKEELDELCNNCYWKLIYSYNGKSVIGYIVYKVKDPADKGEYSSRYSPVGSYSVSDPHIFLPNAGYRYEDVLLRDGSFGGYWSSSLHSNYYPYNAYDLEFNLNPSVFSNHYYRLYGRSVRPVCP